MDALLSCLASLVFRPTCSSLHGHSNARLRVGRKGGHHFPSVRVRDGMPQRGARKHRVDVFFAPRQCPVVGFLENVVGRCLCLFRGNAERWEAKLVDTAVKGQGILGVRSLHHRELEISSLKRSNNIVRMHHFGR